MRLSLFETKRSIRCLTRASLLAGSILLTSCADGYVVSGSVEAEEAQDPQQDSIELVRSRVREESLAQLAFYGISVDDAPQIYESGTQVGCDVDNSFNELYFCNGEVVIDPEDVVYLSDQVHALALSTGEYLGSNTEVLSAAATYVTAHEYAHVWQFQEDVGELGSGKLVYLELEADCLAGASFRGRENLEPAYPIIVRFASYLGGEDHGSGEERASAVYTGIAQGPDGCTEQYGSMYRD